MGEEERYRRAFGQALEAQLTKRNVRASRLASATGISRGYVTHIMKGRKVASPEWCDLVANALQLSAAERIELHRAAAESLGYKLDLTKK